MTWPVTPVVPGGPSVRRWPTPKRRISIGIVGRSLAAFGQRLSASAPPAALASAGPPGRCAARSGSRALRPDRRLRMGELRAGEVALLRHLLLVHLEQRREAEEPD